jgi:hypothetical protein
MAESMAKSMVTIEHLEVEFEVDGDDAAVFERLFRQHIEQWQRRQDTRRDDDERLARSRAIGGRRDEEGRR